MTPSPESGVPVVAMVSHTPRNARRYIEAVESPQYRWVIGVQCHPERADEVPAASRQLFSAFVEAAGKPYDSL